MIKLDLYRALASRKHYPAPMFPIALSGIEYDLALPPSVASALVNLLSTQGPFFRVDSHCNPAGIAELRDDPTQFGPEYSYPFYAEAQIDAEISDGGAIVGRRMHVAMANSLTAAEIVRFTIEGYPFAPDVRAWLSRYSPFVLFSGGFEVARVSFDYAASKPNYAGTPPSRRAKASTARLSSEPVSPMPLLCDMLARIGSTSRTATQGALP